MSLEYIPAWPSFCFAISTLWVGDPLGRDLDRRPGLLFCNFYFLGWRSLGARFGPATRVFVLHSSYLAGGRSRPDADRQPGSVPPCGLARMRANMCTTMLPRWEGCCRNSYRPAGLFYFHPRRPKESHLQQTALFCHALQESQRRWAEWLEPCCLPTLLWWIQLVGGRFGR